MENNLTSTVATNLSRFCRQLANLDLSSFCLSSFCIDVFNCAYFVLIVFIFFLCYSITVLFTLLLI